MRGSRGRLRDRGSVFGGDVAGHLLATGGELIGKAQHDGGAPCGTNIAPAVAAEGAMGGLDGNIYVAFVRLGNATPDLLRGGVDDINERTRSGTDPLAANKYVVVISLKCRHAGASRRVE